MRNHRNRSLRRPPPPSARARVHTHIRFHKRIGRGGHYYYNDVWCYLAGRRCSGGQGCGLLLVRAAVIFVVFFFQVSGGFEFTLFKYTSPPSPRYGQKQTDHDDVHRRARLTDTSPPPRTRTRMYTERGGLSVTPFTRRGHHPTVAYECP